MEENRIYNSHNVALVVKNPPMQKAQEMRFQSLGWEDPLVGSGNPFQYSCLENFMDRGAWRATVHGAAESRTWLSTIAIKLLPVQFSSVAQLCPTLWPHELQHSRPPCPSPTPWVYPNSCPLSRWTWPSHPLLSPSPPAFNFSQHQGLFKWVSSSHQVAKILEFSASTSVLPMITQDWSPLGWTGWISLQSKALSRVFSNTTVEKHQFFGTQLSL